MRFRLADDVHECATAFTHALLGEFMADYPALLAHCRGSAEAFLAARLQRAHADIEALVSALCPPLAT